MKFIIAHGIGSQLMLVINTKKTEEKHALFRNFRYFDNGFIAVTIFIILMMKSFFFATMVQQYTCHFHLNAIFKTKVAK